MNNTYPKGSEWRKWDLQIQPIKDEWFGDLDKKGVQIKKATREYLKKALENNLSVVAITDHNSGLAIDCALEVVQEESLDITVLPGVEIDVQVGYQLIVIFNPSYKEKIQKQTWGESVEHFLNHTCGLPSPVIDKYGQAASINVDIHKFLEKICKEDIGLPILAHCQSEKGLFKKTTDARRKEYFTNCLDGKYYFVLDHKSEESIDETKDILKRWGIDAAKFPYIKTSDAHKASNVGIGFCWIKADPTFEGLKQIIYEPEDRVFVGEEPSVLERVRNNKTKYINSLAINNKPGKKASDGKWFESVNIEFNPELVAIIGNKGSGKSAISDIIGVLGNTHSAGEDHKYLSFLNNSGNQKKFRQKGFAEAFEAKMVWKDSSFVIESLDKEIDTTRAEKVKYLPQNYFESLTNDLEESVFEKTLKSVIFLHIPESNRYGQTNFDDLERYKSSSIQKDLPMLESDLRELSSEIINLEKKNHPDNRRRIDSLLLEKEKELAEHIKNKPSATKNPSGLKIDKAKKLKLREIEALNEDLSRVTSEFEAKKNLKAEIISDKEILLQIHDDLTRFYNQIETYKDQNREIFQNFGFDIDKIVKVELGAAALKTAIEEKEKEEAKLEGNFKTLRELEIDFSGDIEKINASKKISLLVQKNEIEEKLSTLKKDLSKPERDYQEYKEKLKKWKNTKKALKGDEKNPKTRIDTVAFYKDEKDFIENEEKLPKMLKQKRAERIDKSIEIFKKKKEIIEMYADFKKSIDGQIAEDEEFIRKFKMDIDVSFKEDKNFRKNFLAFINQVNKGTFKGKLDGEKFLSKIFEEKDLTNAEDIKTILQTIIEFLETDQRQEVKEDEKERDILDQINQVEEFYKFVFSLGYLKPNYELKLDGKPLEKLSPGEKGALLLVFYLVIDKEDTPLIIDQPEDNLDNKSVFEVLTHFIRFAKERRQIIIVTHNPNLAVGADAEQIIYVNLDKNNDYEFSYQTGSIENPILNKRIVEILEGTQPAFNKRKLKYLRDK